MQQYQQEFIEFLVRNDALKFGKFTFKSGRVAPNFLNMGEFYNASAYVRLVDYYAQAVHENVPDFDVIFGPAYKGIPLAVGTASAYYFRYKREVQFAFNRKEAKDHGEGGMLVGAPITADSKVVVVDDVMTAGTAVRETMALFKSLGGPKVVGVVLACDRMERGLGSKTATQEIEDEFGVPVFSIVNMEQIMEHLHGREIDGKVVLGDEELAQTKAYLAEYGGAV